MLLLTLLLLATPAIQAVPESQSKFEEVTPAELSVGRFRLSSEPNGFDPVRSSQMIDALMQRQVLESLIEYDYLTDGGEVHGLLAESWITSEDALTWTFTLNADASFYDPFTPPLWPNRRRPLIARDVLFSWLRMADARNPSEGYWSMEGVFVGLDDFRKHTAALDPAQAEQAFQDALQNGLEGIQVLDDTHLQVQLLYPDLHFAQRLAMTHFAVYPFEATQAQGRNMLDQPVGSAPFVLQEWVPGQTIRLSRTPAWRGQESPFGDGTLPFLDRVEFHTVRDAGMALNLFDNGEIDRLPLGTSAINHFLDKDFQVKEEFQARGFNFFHFSMPDITMLCFDMSDPILGTRPGDAEGNVSRRLLRQALALTFPHEQWSKIIRGTTPAIKAQTFLPPLVPGSDSMPPSRWNHTDLELAARLLAEAGYPKGKGLPPLEYITSTDPRSDSFAKVFASYAAEIGIHLKIVGLPYAQQLQRQRSGQAQVFLRAWVLDWPDAALILQNFFGPYANTDTNLSGFRNTVFDETLRAMRATAESPERRAMMADLLEILENEVPAAPIDHRRSWLLTQPWLSNFRAHPFDPIAAKYFKVAAH